MCWVAPNYFQQHQFECYQIPLIVCSVVRLNHHLCHVGVQKFWSLLYDQTPVCDEPEPGSDQIQAVHVFM